MNVQWITHPGHGCVKGATQCDNWADVVEDISTLIHKASQLPHQLMVQHRKACSSVQDSAVHQHLNDKGHSSQRTMSTFWESDGLKVERRRSSLSKWNDHHLSEEEAYDITHKITLQSWHIPSHMMVEWDNNPRHPQGVNDLTVPHRLNTWDSQPGSYNWRSL